MRKVMLLVFVLALFGLTLSGCGNKTTSSSMSSDQQADLKKNLELLAVAYKTSTIEQGESPASWSELSRFAKEVEMDVDFQIVKDSGYEVNWNLDVEDVTGDRAGEIVVAQAGENSPKVYLDGTVK